MVFSSITFLFYFLPVLLLAHTFLPSIKAKNTALLIGSLFFYAWGEPVYILLMLISIAGNYFLVKYMVQAGIRENKKMKVHLAFAVAWNLAILFFFKYAGMFLNMFHALTGRPVPDLQLALPIGISFYTFQALSYVIDVYRGETEYQNNIFRFALYISMFPQLIAGPIVKYKDIEKNLTDRSVDLASFGRGAEIFIFGFAKKVLIANSVGAVFSSITAQPVSEVSFLGAWLGAICYTFQIYFDFSGYSDMAIGLGYMFGFKFPLNFDHPYISGSVTEFWRRWHISLSSWFRDYVYIPLGGNRVSRAKHIRNILIVWALTGLWHGANGNFVLWGLYYAAWLIIEKYYLASFLERHPRLSHITTGLIFIFGWVIFAFTDMHRLGRYLLQMIGIGAAGFADDTAVYMIVTSLILLIISAAASTPALYSVYKKVRTTAFPAAVAVLVLLLILSTAGLVYQSFNPFLYFRF